jgi:hypothetical protein
MPEGFEEFWAAFPRKDKRKDALAAWKRLSPSPDVRAKILADVARRRQSQDWLKEGGQFIPNPAAYLNGERWEDQGVVIHQSISQSLGQAGGLSRQAVMAEALRDAL